VAGMDLAATVLLPQAAAYIQTLQTAPQIQAEAAHLLVWAAPALLLSR